MNKNSENTNAFLIHISSFTGYLFPLGSIITPLILWQTQKDKSTFLDIHGKEAVNFNISFAIYVFVLGASFFSFLFGNLINEFNNIDLDFGNHHYHNNIFNFFGVASAVGLVSLTKIALIIIASKKANDGETYSYPFTINFLK